MTYLEQIRDRIVDGNGDEIAEYVCRGCGTGFDGRRQVCPECGGYSIRRREWESIE